MNQWFALLILKIYFLFVSCCTTFTLTTECKQNWSIILIIVAFNFFFLPQVLGLSRGRGVGGFSRPRIISTTSSPIRNQHPSLTEQPTIIYMSETELSVTTFRKAKLDHVFRFLCMISLFFQFNKSFPINIHEFSNQPNISLIGLFPFKSEQLLFVEKRIGSLFL